MPTMKTIQFAPPPPQIPIQRPKSAGTTPNPTPFQWTSWLSPKMLSPRRGGPTLRREQNDNTDDDNDLQQHHRSASFGHAPAAAAPAWNVRLNKERGGESYFKHNNNMLDASVSVSKSNESEEDYMSLATKSKSTDEMMDGARGVSVNNYQYQTQSHHSSSMHQHQQHSSHRNSQSSQSVTYLMPFLFHFNSLLPEYCEHFASISSDTLNSVSGASKAVSVLERGTSTLSVTFGANNIKTTVPMTALSMPMAAPAPPQSSPSSEKRRAYMPPNNTCLSDIGGEAISNTAPPASSAPSSPSYLGTTSSPNKKYLTPTPQSTSDSGPGSPTAKLTDVRHWLSPLSPPSDRSSSRITKKISPKKPLSKKYSSSATLNWTAVVSEWEKFVSPFLMLVGAECLYGGMQHVLDPKLSAEAESSKDAANNNKKGEKYSKRSASFVRFAMNPGGICQETLEGGPNSSVGSVAGNASSSSSLRQAGDDYVPPVALQSNAHKRGSRRLIAMYRQIREDLIIVGEYLCDPVLGKRVLGAAASSGERLPPPLLNLAPSTTSSRSSSPVKNTAGRVGNSSGNLLKRPENVNRYTSHERRDFAAISLRSTLDALISFIEARCVLITIHAELCCSPPPPPLLSSANVGDENDGMGVGPKSNPSLVGRGRKWMALAEQCQCVSNPVSAWAKEEGCMAKSAASGIEKELKALELAMTSIYYLFECNLFNCVLNVRRLHVLLGKIPYHQTCFPIMYVQSSLTDLLAMMQIYFADAGTSLEMLRNLQSSSTPRAMQSGVYDTSTKSPSGKSKVTSFNPLFTEFIGKHTNGVPLAVMVVRRVGDRIDPISEEQQNEGKDDEVSPKPAPGWEPVFINSTLNTGNGVRGTSHTLADYQGHNLVRIIKKNFSTDRESDSKTSDANAVGTDGAKPVMKTTWPFDQWTQIEKVLTEHSTTETAINPTNYSIESVDARVAVSKNVANSKTLWRSTPLAQSRVRSHCHISSITGSICLLVVQGVGPAKKHKASDDEIQQFMQMMVSKICPENLLNIEVVMRLKSESFDLKDKFPEHSKIPKSANDNVPATTSLWSESGWSDSQRKKILHSLGLRRKHSPVMAPLKSPYLNGQGSGKLRRQRKKKMKNSINRGHLDLFLGPELSRLV